MHSNSFFRETIPDNIVRLDYEAADLISARSYLITRARQLLHLGWNLLSIDIINNYAVRAEFEHPTLKKHSSIYLLKQYRGMGLYLDIIKNEKYPIVTLNDCGIQSFLKGKDIRHTIADGSILDSEEYTSIQKFYNSERSKRSKIFLMNHIDEGLYVLSKIGASKEAMKAYCLHPIFQPDENIANIKDFLKDKKFDNYIITLAVEYRSIAMEYLSHRKISSILDIRLSPLKDVNDMLIADKIQNKKDFDLYHKESHQRSSELTEYFENWFERLNINESLYKEILFI